MRFGYNTNGFAHHRFEDALTILAKLGYQSVAITLDHHVLNPFEPDLPGRATQIRKLLEKLGLGCVIETGARFLLDPWQKHQPTLVSAKKTDRILRLTFLRKAMEIAVHLAAEAVSFWSGQPLDEVPYAVCLDRLVEGCRYLCETANRPVRLAFEPEPGMLIDAMAK